MSGIKKAFILVLLAAGAAYVVSDEERRKRENVDSLNAANAANAAQANTGGGGFNFAGFLGDMIGLASSIGAGTGGGSTATTTGGGSVAAPVTGSDFVTPAIYSGSGIRGLRDFIAIGESGGNYNIVWGGIAAADRPPKPLTSMNVGEVLAWQDSIDSRYMSEAAGKYQVLEDTLRGLGLSNSMRFDVTGQDAVCDALLKRRGLEKYLSGRWTVDDFCNSLAKEWASLPVVSGSKAGKSYYDGDGLNSSSHSVSAFRNAVKAAKG